MSQNGIEHSLGDIWTQRFDSFLHSETTRRKALKTMTQASAVASLACRAASLGLVLQIGKNLLFQVIKNHPADQITLTSTDVFGPQTKELADSPITDSSEPSPTLQPLEIAQKEVGNKNAAEYLLDDITKVLKQERKRRLEDPAVKERVNPEFAESDTSAFLVVGIDNTRERPDTRNDQGWGRADLFMLIYFNPHTFETTLISLPRDLFVPELKGYERLLGEGLGVNQITQVPYAIRLISDQFPRSNEFREIDINDLLRKIAETATERLVDGIMRFDIDSMQGYSGERGVFRGVVDIVFPQGLSVNVSQKLVVPRFPTDNFGVVAVNFAPGIEVMDARRITQYSRVRPGPESDFARDDRHQQVFTVMMKDLFPRFRDDLLQGDTKTLDTIIGALGEHENLANLFYDINFINILKNIRDNIALLRGNALGVAKLAALYANTKELIDRFVGGEGVNFFSPSRSDGTIVNLTPAERYFKPNLLKLRGSQTTSNPTAFGNYLTYWRFLKERLPKFL